MKPILAGLSYMMLAVVLAFALFWFGPKASEVMAQSPLKIGWSIRWFNEETALEEKYQRERHITTYGTNNFVMFPYNFNTNVAVAIGAGTNRFAVEFGFREDGVVVWREMKR